ncbi:MAG: DUF983 domain-containing protein [Hyphomicrobiaceae bacterium]
MSDWNDGPPASPLAAGLGAKCPRCGQGKLFDGYLKIRPGCDVCKLDYAFANAGDGPAIFVMLLVGFVIVGGALTVEVLYRPPMWVHVALWVPLTLGLALAVLRPLKAFMIALQYTHQAREGRLSS